MIREIEFRGKSLESKRWIYGSYCCYKDYRDIEQNLIYSRNNGNSEWIEKNTVGQYTGLEDNNGNKIFEGDIVKVYFNTFDDNGYILSTEIVIGEVYFDNNEYSYKVLQNLGIFNDGSFEDYNSIPLYKCINCEVIGNKHDTPELLTHQHEDKGE